MAMSAGASCGIASEINVTPLIDVLLVLLIIFMVIVPEAPRGLHALVPQPASASSASTSIVQPVIVSVHQGMAGAPSYSLNEEPLPRAELVSRLASIFSTRAEKTMFVRGDKDVFYGDVAAVIDDGHQAGVERIGIITAKE